MNAPAHIFLRPRALLAVAALTLVAGGAAPSVVYAGGKSLKKNQVSSSDVGRKNG